jgi:hypothetical protein
MQNGKLVETKSAKMRKRVTTTNLRRGKPKRATEESGA